MIDPKQGEREYFARIGEAGRQHARGKPFSDENCTHYLINISVFLSLMRPAPARIVEFGCGTGWLSLIFAARGYEVVGIDISPDAIAIAEQLRVERQIANASFRTADYEEVRIDPPADYVVFHDALHHAESEDAAMRAAYAALAPGGMMICIEPGDGHSQSSTSLHAVKEFGVHEKDMPPRKIIYYARRAGFKRHMVLPWPWDHLRHIYRPAYARAAIAGDLRGRKWLGLFRALKNLFRHRAQGVVLLWKN
jgi:SAM-dependent methyltransferase